MRGSFKSRFRIGPVLSGVMLMAWIRIATMPLGPTVHQRPHPPHGIVAERIEQTGSFEIAGPRLVREAVFQVAMVVLVGLRDGR